jgi:hypothetical protein
MQSMDLLGYVNLALERSVYAYNRQRVVQLREESSGASRSRVDWTISVNGEVRILLEAKSPVVMEAISRRLPEVSVRLKWQQDTPFLSKTFLKVRILWTTTS